MAAGGALGQQGAPPCYSSLWEMLQIKLMTSHNVHYLTIMAMKLLAQGA